MTTTNTNPDPVEVEILGGVKVKMAPADAEAYRAATKKRQDHADELARVVGATRAEKEAAEAAAARAREDAEAAKLAKDGEIGKVREILTRETQDKLNKVGKAIVESEIRAAVATHAPGLDATAMGDIVALIAPRARFSAETVRGEYLDEAGRPFQVDGKPAGADALVADFLAKRPHLKPTKIPAQTAASGNTGGTSVAGAAISAAAFEAMTPMQQATHLKAGGSILPA
jgi:hypothetical protein